MKKMLTILLILAVAAASVSAKDVTEDREIKTLSGEKLEGCVKAGLLVGMPSGATVGYRFSNWFESNLTAGYNFLFKDAAVVSANGLFTVVNIPAGDAGLLPLSVGPQVNFIFGDPFVFQIVGDVRLEYTFEDIPLNLFVEGGFGFQFNDADNDWIAWNAGIGGRYVF
jgi:hypothetical protein